MNYDYRVHTINAAVTQKDIGQGQLGQKVALQVEQVLKSLDRGGWEFYNSFPVNVNVMPGCFGGKAQSFSTIVMVFRRPLQ